MKPYQYAIAIAPILYGIAESLKPFVPEKYAVWPVIVLAIAMYFMKAPEREAKAKS